MSSYPQVSASSEKRVKDRLPIPVECPHCTAEVEFANNEVIYGRPYGNWPWMYRCTNDDCGAYVGCHPNTRLPLGTLATAPLREARKKAKSLFNPLWESREMTRTEAYQWLAGRLNIAVASCHFGWFDISTCERAIEILNEGVNREPPPGGSVKAFAELRQLLAAKTPR